MSLQSNKQVTCVISKLQLQSWTYILTFYGRVWFGLTQAGKWPSIGDFDSSSWSSPHLPPSLCLLPSTQAITCLPTTNQLPSVNHLCFSPCQSKNDKSISLRSKLRCVMWMLMLSLMLVIFHRPPLSAHCFNHQLPILNLILKYGVVFYGDVDVNVDVNADVDVGGLPSPNLSHRSPLPAHLLHDQLPLPILILVLILMMMLMLTLMLTLKLSLTSM